MTYTRHDLAAASERLHAQLERTVGKDAYDCWFKSLQIESIEGNCVHLGVATTFLRYWITNHHEEVLIESCREVLGVEKATLDERLKLEAAREPKPIVTPEVPARPPSPPPKPKLRVRHIENDKEEEVVIDDADSKPIDTAKKPSIDAIITLVAQEYRTTTTEILSYRRDRLTIWCRHLSIYLAVRCGSKPSVIARFFNRDISTVGHSRGVMARHLRNPVVRQKIEALEKQLLE